MFIVYKTTFAIVDGNDISANNINIPFFELHFRLAIEITIRSDSLVDLAGGIILSKQFNLGCSCEVKKQTSSCLLSSVLRLLSEKVVWPFHLSSRLSPVTHMDFYLLETSRVFVFPGCFSY